MTVPIALVGIGACTLFLQAIGFPVLGWLSRDAVFLAAVICIVGGLGMTGRTEE